MVLHGRHFRNSTILARDTAGSVAGTAVDGVGALLGWLPGPHYTPTGQAWTLIYRGSRDGWKQSDFHSACDGKGPTLVLALGKASGDAREFVAGGYAASSWISSRDTVHDPDPESARSVGRGSFLFSLVDAAGHGPVQVPLKGAGHRKALWQYSGWGPKFGGGSDFAVGGDSSYPLNHARGSWAQTARGLSRSSYDSTAAVAQGCTTFRGHSSESTYRFCTKELEVFALQ